MSRHSYSRYRAARKIALILAAAPLFQLSACQTGFQQISAGVLQSANRLDHLTSTSGAIHKASMPVVDFGQTVATDADIQAVEHHHTQRRSSPHGSVGR